MARIGLVTAAGCARRLLDLRRLRPWRVDRSACRLATMAHGDITHIEIPVNDLPQASAFYSELFGWQFAEMEGFEGYPTFQAPNGVSGGALAQREEGFTQPRNMVEVDSIDETLAKATANGAKVVIARAEITPTSWWAVLQDPDGNHIGLFEGTM